MANETVAVAARARPALPTIRRIGLADIPDALARGWDDFRASPTHLVILALVYPIMGLVLGRIASGYNSVPLLYPLIGGFALIGPIASVGLYEMSKLRERGGYVSWRNAFDVFRSPRIASIIILGGMLGVLFVFWLVAAKIIFDHTLAGVGATSFDELVRATFGTGAGHLLLVLGTGVGLLFAIVALTLGVVSIPLLVDRDVGATPAEEASIAVRTSTRAVAENLLPMMAWGLVVAIGLVLGVATLLVGFAVIMPVLGHATWHLYRKLVA